MKLMLIAVNRNNNSILFITFNKCFCEFLNLKLLMLTLDVNTKTLLPVSNLPCILSLIQ